MPHSLQLLPAEVVFRILSYLHISDLLEISRTCHYLRALACDPLLHLERFRTATYTLAKALAARPSRVSISPPSAWIWLSKTNVISRQISRSLVKIRLSHSLEHRPTSRDLVARAILPSCCTDYSSQVSPALIQSHRSLQKRKLMERLSKKLQKRPSVSSLVSNNIMPEECVNRSVSPGLVARRRQVMKENLKDGLRAWVQGRAIQAQRRRADEMEFTERVTVKNMVRKYSAKTDIQDLEGRIDLVTLEKKRAQMQWGRELELARKREERNAITNGACVQPTRAHVLGLKKFWEGVIRAANVS